MSAADETSEKPATPASSANGGTLAETEAGQRARVSDELVRTGSMEDARSLASIDRPPSKEEIPAAKVYHPLSPHVLALLIPASMFGALARVGLLALTTYDGRAIFPLAWVQAAGCLVMGFGLGMREPIGQFYGPSYTALTTGFCGSLTTFSSWQLDVFSSWLNTTHAHRDWFRDVVDGLGKSVFTLAVSLASVRLGVHLATVFCPFVPSLPPPSGIARNTLTALSVLVYAGAFPAYFRLSPSFRHQATAAVLFAFPGTLSRYLLSINLNPRLSLFPLGTYAANTFGTALIGTFHVLQSTHTPPSPYACAVLQGLIDGYCGCLTTVSTFATEVASLSPGKAWFYVVLSWVTCQLLLLVILGPSYWAGDVIENPTCVFA
ncbi:CrcB-like protein-domain-containing protein [Cytidiella melzeri]|nr:CrcB-like protein-domain-containing protein [Cytidiella melzeri]